MPLCPDLVRPIRDKNKASGVSAVGARLQRSSIIALIAAGSKQSRSSFNSGGLSASISSSRWTRFLLCLSRARSDEPADSKSLMMSAFRDLTATKSGVRPCFDFFSRCETGRTVSKCLTRRILCDVPSSLLYFKSRTAQ